MIVAIDLQPLWDWFRVLNETTGIKLTIFYDAFDRARFFNGFDNRSSNLPGRVHSRFFKQVQPDLWGPVNPHLLTPTPHSSDTPENNTQYTISSYLTGIPGGVNRERTLFNFGDYTSNVASTDREYLYGSFDRDICDKYLTVFADFRYARTYWDGQLAASPFTPDLWVDTAHPTGINHSATVVLGLPQLPALQASLAGVPSTSTIQSIQAAGGKVLAIEAGKTILIDEAETVRLADAAGITIFSRELENTTDMPEGRIRRY